MLLTPEEARQQECPFRHYCVNEASVAQHRDTAIYAHIPCQGPDCKIGWRWGEPQKKRYFVTFRDRPEEEWAWNPHDTHRGLSPDHRDYDYSIARVRIVEEPRHGYCGAFGAPAQDP